MSIDRTTGLEHRDGENVGRAPRRMSRDELLALGHAPMSPHKALRLRCLDCSAGSSLEVRLCTAVRCLAWPFRLGASPWRAQTSPERREQLRRQGIKGAAKRFGDRIYGSPSATVNGSATTRPDHPGAGSDEAVLRSENDAASSTLASVVQVDVFALLKQPHTAAASAEPTIPMIRS